MRIKNGIIILAISILVLTFYFLSGAESASQSLQNTLRGDDTAVTAPIEGDYWVNPTDGHPKIHTKEGTIDLCTLDSVVCEDENKVIISKVIDNSETLEGVEMVQNRIQQKAIEAGFDVDLALRIAQCESGFEQFAENPSPLSSAKGVYQFTDGTWNWIKAPSHQYDLNENIDQFIKWFPIYPSWWEACL